MPIPYLDKLKQLRERIPVGMAEGLKVLSKTNGDVDAAVVNIVEGYLDLIQSKMAVSKERSDELLKKFNYDAHAVLKILQEELDELNHTKTELILKRAGNDRFSAIGRIANLIERANGFQRKQGWLDPDDMTGLSPYHYCLIVIHEWLEYEDCEDVRAAIFFWPDIVPEQIQKMGLEKMAGALRTAYTINKEVSGQFANIEDRHEKAWSIYRKLEADELYKQTISYINGHLKQIVDELHEFVKANLVHFP